MMSNLPDGARIADIPGNTPRDAAFDKAVAYAVDDLETIFSEEQLLDAYAEMLGLVGPLDDETDVAEKILDFVIEKKDAEEWFEYGEEYAEESFAAQVEEFVRKNLKWTEG
jgi:hypothetical protein